MDLDRLDALEKTISNRFESLEQTLKLILSRMDATTNVNRDRDTSELATRRAPLPARPEQNASAGPTRRRPPGVRFRTPQDETRANTASKGGTNAQPDDVEERPRLQVHWQLPIVPSTFGQSNQPQTSKKSSLRRPKSKVRPAKQLRVQTPGGTISVYRASLEGRQFLTPEEQRTEEHDQVVESGEFSQHPGESSDLRDAHDRNANLRRHEPFAEASSGVGRRAKRRIENGSSISASKRRRIQPYVLVDNLQHPRQRRSRSLSATDDVGPSQSLGQDPHIDHDSMVMCNVNEEDDLLVQTDSETPEEDSIIDENELCFDGTFGMDDIPDLPHPEIKDPDIEDNVENGSQPQYHRNGDVDYGDPLSEPIFNEENNQGLNEDALLDLKPDPPIDSARDSIHDDGAASIPPHSALPHPSNTDVGSTDPSMQNGQPQPAPVVQVVSDAVRHQRVSNIVQHGPARRIPKRLVRVKHEHSSIGPDGVRERLEGLESFSVTFNLTMRSITVDRPWMTTKFGASPQSLYSKPDRPGPEYRFMFPNPNMNPEVPRVPGQPGLLCRAVDFVPWANHIIKVLVRLAANKWHYLGDYKSAPVRPLTRAEFLEFSSPVQNSWVKYVSQMGSGPYVELRAKMALHQQFGREPSEDELNDALATGNKFKDITKEVVLDAYLSGRHIIYIWKLWCVDYDEEFQRRLALEYMPTPSRPRKKNQQIGAVTEDSLKEENIMPPMAENIPLTVPALEDEAGAVRRSGRLGDKPRRRYKEFEEEELDFKTDTSEAEVEATVRDALR